MRVKRENIDPLMLTVISRTLYIHSPLGNYSSQAGEADGGSKWSHFAGVLDVGGQEDESEGSGAEQLEGWSFHF